MAGSNKLIEIYAKTEFAVDAVNLAHKQINHPGALWYHVIGLFNAFYSINEELKNHTKNGSDKALTLAVEAWWKANGNEVEAFFGGARNTATHQGAIFVEPFLEWEWDIPNDTEHPVQTANVTIAGSQIIAMSGLDFLNLCEEALTFMRNGIRSIDEDYKSRGGADHALPAD